jgi:hypothetical protein
MVRIFPEELAVTTSFKEGAFCYVKSGKYKNIRKISFVRDSGRILSTEPISVL